MAATPSKDGAVAPQERVNISYKTDNNGVAEDVELPLRMLVTGDFTGRPDSTPLEERQPISLDKNNFDDVLRNQHVQIDMQVDNVVSGKAGDKLHAKLNIDSLKDFEPDAIARKVPELAELLELREALTELKGPLSQNAEFRRKLQKLLDEESSERSSLLDEIGLGPVK